MNNPNPFVPKGSLLEQQSLRRSRLKIAVTCFLVVGVLSLVGLLIEGCKREKPADENSNNLANTDTNPPVMDQTNPPINDASNIVSTPPIPMPTNPVPQVIDNTATGSEYIVIAGDTLAKIAKKNGVTLKALEAANPGVDSRKLKIKQKIVIPAGGKTATDNSSSAAPGVADSGTETYKIKSGDTLTKIAKAHGTTVKAIQAANNLTTTKIAVGKTLKIPTKSAPVPAAPATPVMDTPPPAPLPAATTTSSAAPGPVK